MKFIDLFAGTGGMRLGLEQACGELGIDCECVFSSEIDKNACKSYELNFGDNPYCDVRQIDELPSFDFMLAGFPCQTFSYAGKRAGFGDTRGTLFFEVERLLKKYRPKAFLLENVRGLTTHDKGRTFETIISSLNQAGYSVKYALLNSSNFSVPQNRVRIYIVGFLGDSVDFGLSSDLGAADSHRFREVFSQPSLFEMQYPYKVVGDVLETDVPARHHCTEKFISMLKNVVGNRGEDLHGYRLIDYRGGKSIHSWELGIKGSCSKDEVEFMNLLIANRRRKIFGTHQDGKKLSLDQIRTFCHKENLLDVIASLISKGYLQEEGGRYNPVCGNMSFEVFKFLDPESISITLTASDANRLGVVQEGQIRKVTPRECARLQGFPDSYRLLDNDSAVYKQMGNAVSVPVIKAVVKELLEHNDIAERHSVSESSSFLYKKAQRIDRKVLGGSFEKIADAELEPVGEL